MNPLRFDLNLLTVLNVLLRERSVSRAAAQLHLSQPAVSHALARARQAFGDPLLVREGSVMRPTPQALRLARPLAEVRAGMERMVQTTRSFDPKDLQGEVRLAVSDYADVLLLPGLLDHLQAHAPGLRVLRRDLSSDKVGEDLASGQIDMAISFKLPGMAGVHERRLFDERHVGLAHESMRGAMTLKRYVAARHVQISYRGSFAGDVDEALGRLGVRRTVVAFTPHVLAAAAAVAGGGLVMTMPERLARRLVGLYPLRLFELPFELPPLHLTLAWHGRSDADAAQGWLRESIAAVAAEHAAPRPAAT